MVNSRRRLWRDRRGAIAVMFALALIPLLMIVSLAVDYSFAIQARAQLNLAADAASMHAVRVATQTLNGGSTIAQAQAAGVAAGQQWFAAQLGGISTASVPTTGVSVNMTYTPSPGSFTATVTYAGSASPPFSGFVKQAWAIAGNASAVIVNSYLEVQILLDNSASMLIGASPSDMQRMMQLSPCAPSEVAQDINTNANPTNAAWPEYRCSWNAWNYTLTPCPVQVSAPWTISQLTPLAADLETPLYGPSCKGQPQITQNKDGTWPYAAAPCAFACHSDATKPAGSGNDLLGVARGTLGSANPVTLRLDVLKRAVNSLIITMEHDNSATNSLTLGIWDFNTALNRDYPSSGEAGADFAAAAAAVGLPPTVAYGAESGIIPDLQVGGAAKPDTYWDAAGTQLATTLTPSGNGNTAAAPRKVLFIIGDGLADEYVGTTRVVGLYNTEVCTTFKNMGYTVYVLFTPYYPLAERDYASKFNLPALVEPTTTSQSAANLQGCASAPADYIEATDLPGVTAALQTFLTSAMSGAARVSQ